MRARQIIISLVIILALILAYTSYYHFTLISTNSGSEQDKSALIFPRSKTGLSMIGTQAWEKTNLLQLWRFYT